MQSVLQLTSAYTGDRITSMERALKLVLTDKAEIVESLDYDIHASNFSIQAPSVIRLKTYHNVPKRNAKWSPKGILARDNHTCAYCGKEVHGVDATIDHVIPVSHFTAKNRAKANTWTNTVCACRKCNLKKGNRTPHDAGMKFIEGFEPKTPRVNYLVMTSHIRPEWRKYILVD